MSGTEMRHKHNRAPLISRDSRGQKFWKRTVEVELPYIKAQQNRLRV
jgi:hypothetical protein